MRMYANIFTYARYIVLWEYIDILIDSIEYTNINYVMLHLQLFI